MLAFPSPPLFSQFVKCVTTPAQYYRQAHTSSKGHILYAGRWSKPSNRLLAKTTPTRTATTLGLVRSSLIAKHHVHDALHYIIHTTCLPFVGRATAVRLAIDSGVA